MHISMEEKSGIIVKKEMVLVVSEFWVCISERMRFHHRASLWSVEMRPGDDARRISSHFLVARMLMMWLPKDGTAI